LETNYTSSRVNQLLQVQMPRGSVTQYRTFVYSGHLLQSATHPESGTTSYTYNGDYTLATRTDAKGQRTEYSYDSLKRVTVVRYFIGGIEDPNQRVDYRYDWNPYDPSFSQYAQGRLVAIDYYAGG